MPKSYQNYYSKWIESAKTEPTRTKRIALAVSTLAKGMSFPEMIRSSRRKTLKRDKNDIIRMNNSIYKTSAI